MRQHLAVDGESLDDLLRFLPYLKTRKTKSGMVKVNAEVPNEVMAPFLRALMRREARLLREDADILETDVIEPRTQVQRRADAFVDLVTSVSAAAKYRGRTPGSGRSR